MVKTDITLPLDYKDEHIKESISTSLGFPSGEITETALIRRTLTVDPDRAYYKCTVAFSASEEREQGLLKMRKRVFSHSFPELESIACSADFRPVVVGAGPAGLFAALYLAECGARPIVLERGEPIEDRAKKVAEFNLTGRLDPESNIQFGEGGAGTYSDGKLKVGSMDKYKWKVLCEFISAGAARDIAYSTSAHLGTDRLGDIVKNIRRRIISLGGEVRFRSRLTDLIIHDGVIAGVRYSTPTGETELSTRAVIIAAGHSARDVFSLLRCRGVPMVCKGFGIGMRIEHPREYINGLVYGRHSSDITETASYHLVTHLPTGRSVYSFCMCPGGTVVSAATEGAVVTNGMSELARMGENSNAALLVSMTPEDFGNDPFAGIAFQERIEHRVYSLTEGYAAPAETLDSFLNRSKTDFSEVKPSYPRGVVPISADGYLPDAVTDSLRQAFTDFDLWMPGFLYPPAALTGPETRTTSPIRVLRNDSTMEALTVRGLFPTGEGAGYSGGIVSSAVDGLRVAERLVQLYGDI